MILIRLVLDKTLHKGTKRPLFGTRGILIFYIAIALYLITDFYFIFSILHYTFSTGEGPDGGAGPSDPADSAYNNRKRLGVPSLLHLAYMPKTTRSIVVSTVGNTVHFHEGLGVNKRQGEKMVICFNRPIRHGGDHLKLALLPP